MGLKHSCEPSSGDGVPECGNKAEFIEAVMYASVDVDKRKRALKRNDKNRAACLYYDRN